MIITRKYLASVIPVRPRDSHKGNYGRVLILAGSTGYTGAARLAAMGALRSGAGLVSLGTPSTVYPVIAACEPETMVFPVADDGNGRMSLAAYHAFAPMLESADCCLIGPGLGRSDELSELVAKVVASAECTVVLDADGINALSGNMPVCRKPLVITPHAGEYARLKGGGASEFARNHNCVLVLKGAGTAVADHEGGVWEYRRKNPGLSVGGSGDLLAGIIASFIAQSAASPEIWRGRSLGELAAAGVCVHGEAGAACARELGEYGMLPSDTALKIPEILTERFLRAGR